jgi:hypothetical protein
MRASTDEYTRRARLAPVRLVILPLVLAVATTIILVFGDLNAISRLGAGVLVGIATNFGLMRLLEQFGRDQGKKKEPGLWASWGGAPTTQMFRQRVEMCNPVMRQRYHENMKQLVPDVKAPTAEDEMREPLGADDTYEAWTRFLINQTRDSSRFPLVFTENVNYGFRRNLWGMRPAAIAITILAILLPLYPTGVAWASKDPPWVLGVLTIALNTCLLVWWLLRITPHWVFIPAKAYAERLLEASDSLQ